MKNQKLFTCLPIIPNGCKLVGKGGSIESASYEKLFVGFVFREGKDSEWVGPTICSGMESSIWYATFPDLFP